MRKDRPRHELIAGKNPPRGLTGPDALKALCPASDYGYSWPPDIDSRGPARL